MPHFKMSSGRDDGEESSDSDHKHKRRKMNQMPFHHGAPTNPSTSSPANPNSFASKMMAKMGYVEGQGLGATGRGRLAPIETQLRPQGAGLGAVKEKTKQAKEEERREAAFRGEKVDDSSEEEKKRRKKLKEKRMSGVSSGAGTPRARPKPKYRTAAEIESVAAGLELPNVLKSIIDVTGQETRLLTSTSGLMSMQMVPAETELMKLSRSAQRESMAFVDESRGLQERKEFFLLEQEDLEKKGKDLEDEIRQMQNLYLSIQDLQSASSNVSSDAELAWESVTSKLETMDRLIDAQGDKVNLQETAVGAVHPLFKLSMQDWEPLQEPLGVSPYLHRLKNILCVSKLSSNKELALQDENNQSTRLHSKSTSPYETMIYTLWLPPVRSAINKWDVYSPDVLLALVEAWKDLLPPFVLANVIDQLVVQRLTSAVGAWKPRKSHSRRPQASPPHVWIFPWLQYLDDQHTDPNNSTGLMSDVKRKFKSLLSSWSVSAGVIPGLSEWRSIFASVLSTLLVRHLLPQLVEHLAELEVDPSDQDLSRLEQVLAWAPFFSLDAMTELMARIFFPKFHETLLIWLTHASVNYDEVSEWMKWWKQQLGEGLPGSNETAVIAAEWTKAQTTILIALDAIEEGHDVTEALRPSLTEPAIAVEENQPPPVAAVPKPMEAIYGFKDVVEDWCEENGLLMFPMREADLQSGQPLFRITASASGKGGVVVYLKGDVLWARGPINPDTQTRFFKPAGLEPELVARAEGK